jgi:nucleotide-binding universal stress UspA family protein
LIFAIFFYIFVKINYIMSRKNIVLPLVPNIDAGTFIISGIKLASALNAKLTFLYVLNTPNYAAYSGSMAVGTMAGVKEQKEAIEANYLKLLSSYKSEIPANMAIERDLIEGPWVGSIIRYLEKHNVDILLLRHEEHGIIDKILGDSNSEIINHANIPVWIIPNKYRSGLPENIAYLSDHRRKDIKALKELQSLCEAFNANFYLVHVNDKDDFEALIKKEGFKAILAKELKDCRIEHLDISRGEMHKNIGKIIEKKNIDMISMMNESENFMSRFFSRSSVDKLINDVDIPLAIYSQNMN